MAKLDLKFIDQLIQERKYSEAEALLDKASIQPDVK